MSSRGPLAGLRVLELAAIGPAPFGCMLLADLGAEVLLVERPETAAVNHAAHTVLFRNRRRVVTDLKRPDGVATVLDLAADADVLVEGFRPGVAERLGVGPEECAGRNPRLVYARMTGWGQHGPLARTAGHDINYLAQSGALGALGPAGQPPVPPLNLLGDFGAGGMLLAFGILAAVHGARASGLGQVVDAAILDGTTSTLAMLSALRAAGAWSDERGANLFDGGAAYYGTYECADGGFIALGAVEPQFYDQLLDGLGLDPETLPDRHDPAGRERLRAIFEETIKGRTRQEWTTVFAGTDACVNAVLTPAEAVVDRANAERGTWIELDGTPQPAPAPRFSRTPAPAPHNHTEPERQPVTWIAPPRHEPRR